MGWNGGGDNAGRPTLVAMGFTERSRPARDAILTAARGRFTDEGYERTTIRAVAADAGQDPSMVMRYYGSKEGLFAATVDLDLRLPDAESSPDQLGARLALHFIAIWEVEPAKDALLVLLRSAATYPYPRRSPSYASRSTVASGNCRASTASTTSAARQW